MQTMLTPMRFGMAEKGLTGVRCAGLKPASYLQKTALADVHSPMRAVDTCKVFDDCACSDNNCGARLCR